MEAPDCTSIVQQVEMSDNPGHHKELQGHHRRQRVHHMEQQGHHKELGIEVGKLSEVESTSGMVEGTAVALLDRKK